MTDQVVAVIGAGVMGSDVAIDLAAHGFTVMLKDLTDERLDQARARLQRRYRLVKMVKKDWATQSLDELLTRIRFVTDYDGIEEAGIVIENITENYEAKERVYLEMGERLAEDTLVGVNTSCISITKIGALMPSPHHVIGMHFLNPVPLKTLVEVIRGHHTSDETIGRTKRFLKRLDKRCVVVNDSPGFVTNRVMMLTINECIWLVQDQVASPRDIDTIFKVGFSHKMGPLATADLIGLDTILNSLAVLHDSYKDPKFRPCPLLKKMVEEGCLGEKSGRGFFEYSRGCVEHRNEPGKRN